jgi:hypothetical protein
MARNFGKVNVSIAASTGGLTRGLSSAQRQLGSFASKVGGVLRSLAGPLLVLGSVTTAVAAFGRTASEIDEASKAARRLGMETSTFQTLGAVAGEAGVSISQMSTMMTFMSRNIGNLSNGVSSAQKYFGNLGITLAQLQGLRPEDQFALIAQRIAALPTAAQRTAAAMEIFGRSGAIALGMIEDAAGGAIAEMAALREAAGVNVTDEQAKGVEMMNDAWGRTSIVVQGFITQLVAGVAPAITTMSNLWTEFSTQSASGWSLAGMAASTFSATLRGIVALATILYGTFQIANSAILKLGQWGLQVFGAMNESIAVVIGSIASLVESLPGADLGVAATLRAAEDAVRNSGGAASDEASVWGQAAADSFAAGVQNIQNPLAAWDAEYAKVTETMAAAGKQAGQAQAMEVVAAVKASSESLKAMVLGTSDAESYRNRIAMGFDPRDAKDDTKRTADGVERVAEGVDELNENFADMGLGLATIQV